MLISIIAPGEIPSRRANTIQVMKMAQAITKLGHKVHLLAPCRTSFFNRSKISSSDWDTLSQHYGLSHRFDISWLPASPVLRRYDFAIQAVQQARREKATLVYTRLPQAAALASWLKLPVIFEIHDMPQGVVGPWLFQRFLHSTSSHRLVSISKALAKDLSHRFNFTDTSPFQLTAPDGVDLERYKNLPSPIQARRKLISTGFPGHFKQWGPDVFTVGYTGHLYPGRGITMLLELVRRLPEINFLIVGGEPAPVAEIREQAKTYNLGNLILTGFIPNADLPLYQAACDLFLMPYQSNVAASSGGDISRYLSPMKLFEYLACGRAIISSNLPVLQEVLNANNALLIPGDQIDSWEDSIRRLAADKLLRERLATQAQNDARNYTWEARAALILEGMTS